MPSSPSALVGMPRVPRELSAQRSLSQEFASPDKLSENSSIQREQDVDDCSGWNAYLNWDLPELAYQNNTSPTAPSSDLAWQAGRPAVKTTDTMSYMDQWQSAWDESGNLTYPMVGSMSNADFGALHLFPSLEPSTDQMDYPTQTGRIGLLSSQNSYDTGIPSEASHNSNAADDMMSWSPDIKTGHVSSVEKTPSLSPMALTKEEDSLQGVPLMAHDEAKSPTTADIDKKRKNAHSVIEKNYRSRINSGLAELRTCVPNLQLNGPAHEYNPSHNKHPVDDQRQNHSSGKVAILSDAVRYVKTLEKQNKVLYEKLDVLQRRHDLLQKIALSKINPTTPPDDVTVQDPGLGEEDVQPIPEAFADLKTRKRRKKSPPGRARSSNSVDIPAIYSDEDKTSSRSYIKATSTLSSLRRRYGSAAKYPAGILAAITLLERVSESNSNGKMLFALPTELFGPTWRYVADMNSGFNGAGFLSFLKVILVLTMLCSILWSLVGAQKTPAPDELSLKLQSRLLTESPPLASPLDDRRNAWLTSMQSVFIPSRHLSLELGALSFKLIKVGFRNILGWKLYAYLTGAGDDDEKARIKAWDIAIDAQLAGGDADIGWNRLILTFIASTTLPETPGRLMLKALHIQVINAFIQQRRYFHWFGAGKFTSGLSEYYWARARTLHRMGLRKQHNTIVDVSSDPLPSSYAELLEQQSYQVFNVAIMMRAYSLALNEPLDRLDIISDEGLDTVIEDIEVRSPLDALAAWFSSLCLRRALIGTLDATNISHISTSPVYQDISLAIKVAPKGSVAETRALASRSIFCAGNRQRYIYAALAVLPITPAPKELPIVTSHPKNIHLNFIRPTISRICTTSVRISLRSAILLERAKRADPTALYLLISLAAALDQDDVSLLGFAAAYQCLRECAPGTEKKVLSNRLRALMGNTWSSWSEGHGVPVATVESVVQVCENLGKSRDQGRESPIL